MVRVKAKHLEVITQMVHSQVFGEKQVQEPIPKEDNLRPNFAISAQKTDMKLVNVGSMEGAMDGQKGIIDRGSKGTWNNTMNVQYQHVTLLTYYLSANLPTATN